MEIFKQIIIKYASWLMMLLTVIGLGWFAYTTYMGKKDLERKYADLVGTQTKYEQLTQYVAKLENQYRDQATLHAAAKKEWKDQAGNMENRIKVLSDATYLMRSYAQHNNVPDLVYEGKTPETSYVYYEIEFIEKDGKKGPPVGYVMVYKTGKIVSKIYDYQLIVHTAVSRNDDSGQYAVLSKAEHLIKSGHLGTRQGDRKIPGKEDWRNRPYPLNIVGGTAMIDPTEANIEPKFFLWAPHINGGLNAGVEAGGFYMRPNISFSVAGYGKTPNDLKWKILQPGIAFDSDLKFFDLNVMPFSYRIFDSFITNTYIGPGVGWSSRGMNYFLGLSLGF